MKSWNPFPLLFAVLFAAILMATAPTPADAQLWKIRPDYQQKLTRLGVYDFARIDKDNVMKAETPETPTNNRISLMPNTSGPWGSFDPIGHRELPLLNVSSWGGAEAAANAKALAEWTYWAPNTSATNPFIKAGYDINNMAEAQGTVAVTKATARSCIASYIERQIQYNSPNPTGIYVCSAEVTLNGDYQSDVNLNADGSVVLPEQRSTMIAKFGLCTIKAVWDPLMENPELETQPLGGWIIEREIWDPAANAVVKKPTELVHGFELDKTYFIHTKIIGSAVLLYSCQVGPTDQPTENNFNGEDDITALTSSAYTPGTTGTEQIYNDHWTGSVKVTPFTTILHTAP